MKATQKDLKGEIADGVKITVLRGTLADVLNRSEPAASSGGGGKPGGGPTVVGPGAAKPGGLLGGLLGGVMPKK